MKNKYHLIFCLSLSLQTLQGMENPWLENLMVPLWMHLIHNAQQVKPVVPEKKYHNPPQKQRRIKRTQQPQSQGHGARIQQPH